MGASIKEIQANYTKAEIFETYLIIPLLYEGNFIYLRTCFCFNLIVIHRRFAHV